MKELLITNFISHYDLLTPPVTDFTIETNEPYFEIEDDSTKGLGINTVLDSGTAKFSNKSKIFLSISNYEKFVTSLPNHFQRNKGRCDFVMCCKTNRYFILGELKDSSEIKYYRKKARKQLLTSLKTLLSVPEILAFANNKSVKRCCYFNKQAKSPITQLNAVTAFNRLSNLYSDGFKMSNLDIESLGFEFYEYTGTQTMVLNN